MEPQLSTMKDRDILIMVYTKQENLEDRLTKIETSLSAKADSKRLEEIEGDVKDLRKSQWMASGAVGAILWAFQHFFR